MSDASAWPTGPQPPTGPAMPTGVQPPTRMHAPRQKLLSAPIMRWALWDWGSAAFNAVATTFVFSVYLTSDGMFTDAETANVWFSRGMTIAGIIIALLAPVTGQRADRQGKGGVALAWFSFGVFLCLGGMFFVAPNSPIGPVNALLLGIGLLGLGNVFFEFASVNYNAMLNHLTTRDNMGRVSGFGWGLGYVGGIVLLLILFVAFINPDPGLFGVGHDNGLNVRVSMVVAALWFGAFALPVIVRPPKPARVDAQGGHESLLESYRLLFRTVARLGKEAPHMLFFLISSAIYRDGLAGVFTFGAILAASVFHFDGSEIIIFAIAANVVAGVATIIFGAVDDKVGPKKVIVFSLVCMLVAGLSIFFLHNGGKIVFWTLGLLLCVFVGPAQSASRSFLARVVPEGREGEVFGLYATTGRAVSFLSPWFYGLAIVIGKGLVPAGTDATYFGILGIMVVLLAGLLTLLPIKQSKAHLNMLDG